MLHILAANFHVKPTTPESSQLSWRRAPTGRNVQTDATQSLSRSGVFPWTLAEVDSLVLYQSLSRCDPCAVLPGRLKPFIPTWSYCRVLDRLFLVRLVLRLFVSTRRSKTRGGRGMTHVFNLTRQGPVPFHPFFFFCCNASPLEPVAVSSGALPTACNVALLSP